MSIFYALIVGLHPCKDCKVVKRERFNDVQICSACRAWEAAKIVSLDRLSLMDYIREVVNGRAEIHDSKKHNYSLYESYFPEMPYGTAKARSGDPDEWMFERLIEDYSHLIEAEV